MTREEGKAPSTLTPGFCLPKTEGSPGPTQGKEDVLRVPQQQEMWVSKEVHSLFDEPGTHSYNLSP